MTPNTGIVPYLLLNSSLHVLASSTSFSMLPSQLKIFHGRESEVENIMKLSPVSASKKNPTLLDPWKPSPSGYGLFASYELGRWME
jgi:hypothetical protein